MKILLNQIAKIGALSVLCVLWLSMDNVYAQAYPVSTVGNVVRFGPALAAASNAANFTFAPAAGAGIQATASNVVTFTGGRTATIVARAAPAAVNVAKMLATRASLLGVVVGAGVAAYDYAKENGYSLSYNSVTGKMEIGKISQCDNTMWRLQYGNGTYYCSKAEACAANGGFIWQGPTYPQNIGRCEKSGANLGDWVSKYEANPPATYTPSTFPEYEQSIRDRLALPVSPGSKIFPAIQDALVGGQTLELPAPSGLSGPSTVALPESTVTRPDGSSTVSRPALKLDYGPDSLTATKRTEIQELDPMGNPLGTTVTEEASDPEPVKPPSEDPKIETCGLPGKPACKIDETGTPAAEPATKYDTAIDAFKQTADTNRGVIAGAADKPFFTGWAVFFNAPPVAECVPYSLPQFNGQSMGAIDPCGVVGGVRVAMAYIWALAGLYLSLGMIRRVA